MVLSTDDLQLGAWEDQAAPGPAPGAGGGQEAGEAGGGEAGGDDGVGGPLTG